MIDFKDKTCWIITEGLIGTQNQCVGIAQALNVPYQILQISLKQPWRSLSPWLGFEHANIFTPALPHPPWPDLLIASGRKSIAAARYIKSASEGKTFTIYIQDPRIPPRHFDLVIAPAHDRVHGDNVVHTTASPNRITSKALKQAVHDFPQFSNVPQPKIALMLGGKSRAHDMRLSDIKTLCAQLKPFETSLMITASRRTPQPCIEHIRKQLPQAYIWDGQGANPYFAMLGAAQALIVTNDSASMLSEAATTGKPVYYIPLHKKRAATRLKKLQERLEDRGALRPFKGKIESWDYKALDDANKAAKAIQDAFTKSHANLY